MSGSCRACLLGVWAGRLIQTVAGKARIHARPMLILANRSRTLPGLSVAEAPV